MERPALQALIQDIKAGLIDVIVVYKVDRLTRSLTDFAKLVDVFDEHDVSFVSVTQAFNTTTSMGRLTLNVLLSFAQFEREVTAERIRDKFAASKKKGIWMGGTCPFGYGHKDRKLYIEDNEAKTIRSIFNLYIKLRNVRLVKSEIDQRAYKTRLRTQKSGKVVGGKPFSRGHIYRILTNPIYIGNIQHKENVYMGEHQAIITQQIWDHVQSTLKSNAARRQTLGNSKSNALLAGLLFDTDGNTLVPHHAKARGVRYEYYVSQRLKAGDQDSGWRLPAGKIEDVITKLLADVFGSQKELMALIPLSQLSADRLQGVSTIAKSLRNQLKSGEHADLKSLLHHLIETITLETNQIAVTFKSNYLAETFGLPPSDQEQITLSKPMTIKRRGQEMRMVIGSEELAHANPDQALIKLVAQAYALRTGLEDGSVSSIKNFAESHGIDHADAKRMLPLSYLAPDIVEAILEGRQPEGVCVSTLRSGYGLPMPWAEQRRKLDFPART